MPSGPRFGEGVRDDEDGGPGLPSCAARASDNLGTSSKPKAHLHVSRMSERIGIPCERDTIIEHDVARRASNIAAQFRPGTPEGGLS